MKPPCRSNHRRVQCDQSQNWSGAGRPDRAWALLGPSRLSHGLHQDLTPWRHQTAPPVGLWVPPVDDPNDDLGPVAIGRSRRGLPEMLSTPARRFTLLFPALAC